MLSFQQDFWLIFTLTLSTAAKYVSETTKKANHVHKQYDKIIYIYIVYHVNLSKACISQDDTKPIIYIRQALGASR